MSRVIGVILAGGKGVRFGQDLPKQFTKLAGKMVIEHVTQIFEKSDAVDEIVVVAKSDYAGLIWELANKNGWGKLAKVVNGGDDRYSSTRSAIVALADYPDDTKILLHDAVRPLLSERIIDDCVSTLDFFSAVDVVIPSSDTLVVVQDNGCISSIPARASMRRGQTPQAFTLRVLKDAYARADKLGRSDFTCDCGVVRAMLPQVEVATVAGSETNIKITNPLDLFLAEKLIQSKGLDVDIDTTALASFAGKRVVVFGASSGIGQELARLLVIHGARVFGASRSLNGVDIADLSAVQAYLATCADEAGGIDCVVNTAGVLIKKPLALTAEEEIADMMGVNYVGAVNVAYAAKPYLAQTKGALLNFTSSSYTRGRAFYAVYSSTKAAVVNLTQALAEEWADDGIRVNCINPERTNTPMRTRSFGAEPPATLLDPKQVAISSALTLLSDHTGMIVDVRKQAIAVA
jgi:2-C-methyl-D-erythritol 4-phosphate cytidylyltransferase